MVLGWIFSFLMLLLFCARANDFKLIHSFGMFGRSLNPPLHVFFWVIISEFPYFEFKYGFFDLGEMFHNVIIKKIVLLVVLIDSELYHNFCVIILFLPLLQDSTITWQNTNIKISFINFFIWFIWLSVKFFSNIWSIQNAHELQIKICFINIVYCIFYICSGV